ncbi:Iron uptake protein [Thauera humireducens]|uniref:DUF3325 domain-containing protein n=1 Tax=Thauera humireducens TaxID=1134435 RepID=UPI002467A716|nr:DUF3325 domain-containing protein [Thauera humireducens]CAH1747776.1 Iron uptake protein [Thauera humireducens]
MSAATLVWSLTAAYGGMLAICLGIDRHAAQLNRQHWPAAIRRALPVLGMVLIGTSLYAASGPWPIGMAVVATFGLVSIGGLALLLLLPYAPRVALWLPSIGVGLALAVGAA